MRWECGECGARADEAQAPDVCRECGIAGGAFVPAERDRDDDELRTAWLRAGLESRAFLTERTPR